VTIIYLLLERHTKPPQARHALFKAYFDTIYTREAAKPGSLAGLLNDQHNVVTALHEQIGLELQVVESRGENSVSRGRLHEVALRLLAKEGYNDDEARGLARQITRASTERLVLLTPSAEGVGFEIRSLQEYMAARAITRGADDNVLKSLTTVASFLNWRNVYLLAVGRLFTERSHVRQRIIGELHALDARRPQLLLGAELALEMLGDDIGLRSPLYQRQLFELALGLLGGPPTSREQQFARVAFDLYSDRSLKETMFAAFARNLAGPADSAASTRLVLNHITNMVGALPARARQLMARSRLASDQMESLSSWTSVYAPRQIPGAKTVRLGRVLKRPLSSLGLDGDSKAKAERFIKELDSVILQSLPPSHTAYVANTSGFVSTSGVADDPDVIAALMLAIGGIPAEGWLASALILRVLRQSSEGNADHLSVESIDPENERQTKL
jgi:hypothetical protein